MGAQHTEGRLVHHPEDNIFTIDGRRVFEVQARSLDVHCDERDANARRLTACWNACDGVPTDMLETIANLVPATVPYRLLRAQRDKLLAALRLCNARLLARMHTDSGDDCEAYSAACAAIAKAEAA
jgi:hypothetical protein